MGLVNSPSFPQSGIKEQPKPKKGKKAEPVIEEPITPEECCQENCDGCSFSEVAE
jgi:hypothetical protein